MNLYDTLHDIPSHGVHVAHTPHTGTQGSASDSLQTLWQDYEIINSLTKVIKEKQGASPITLPDRRECLPQFEKWLTENGAKYDEMVCKCVCV